MKIIELKEREGLTPENKLDKCYIEFKEVLSELSMKELPDTTVVFINKNIEELNATLFQGKDLQKHIKKQQSNILKLVLKEHKIVTKNHYVKLWMLLGMPTFGIPLGLAFGLDINNMGILAIGLPIGMGMGIGVGALIDGKALIEERQLNIELKN